MNRSIRVERFPAVYLRIKNRLCRLSSYSVPSGGWALRCGLTYPQANALGRWYSGPRQDESAVYCISTCPTMESDLGLTVCTFIRESSGDGQDAYFPQHFFRWCNLYGNTEFRYCSRRVWLLYVYQEQLSGLSLYAFSSANGLISAIRMVWVQLQRIIRYGLGKLII